MAAESEYVGCGCICEARKQQNSVDQSERLINKMWQQHSVKVGNLGKRKIRTNHNRVKHFSSQWKNPSLSSEPFYGFVNIKYLNLRKISRKFQSWNFKYIKFKTLKLNKVKSFNADKTNLS